MGARIEGFGAPFMQGPGTGSPLGPSDMLDRAPAASLQRPRLPDPGVGELEDLGPAFPVTRRFSALYLLLLNYCNQTLEFLSIGYNRKTTACGCDVLTSNVGRFFLLGYNRNIDIKGVPYYDERAKKGLRTTPRDIRFEEPITPVT
jgi:hypothetical protein